MRGLFFTAILFVFLTACASQHAPQIAGETLIQKMPLPAGEWEVQQFPSEKTKSMETRWTSKSSSAIAQTFVFYQKPNADVTQPKREDDRLGEQSCEGGFSSKILTDASQNGYPQVTWRSLCRSASGATAFVLHKVISGNEAQYMFRRTFVSVPEKEEWLLWLNYIRKFSVCDTSQTGTHQCPPDIDQIKKEK